MAAGVVGLSLRDALSSPRTPPPSTHLPQATIYPWWDPLLPLAPLTSMSF